MFPCGRLHDTKLVMEAQIRDELEAEYAAQQEDESRSISELENTLRRQLAQAKSDQEDLLMKVRDSQQQFQAVREGFNSTLVPMSMHNPIATIKLWHIPLSRNLFPLTFMLQKSSTRRRIGAAIWRRRRMRSK